MFFLCCFTPGGLTEMLSGSEEHLSCVSALLSAFINRGIFCTHLHNQVSGLEP